MDLSPIIARLEAESQNYAAGSGDPMWAAIFDAIEQLKHCGDDYDKAHAAYSLIMRLVIDHWPNPSDSMPSLESLGAVMGRWRRARNIKRDGNRSAAATTSCAPPKKLAKC